MGEQNYRGPDRRRHEPTSRAQLPSWTIAATLAGALGCAALVAVLAHPTAPDGARPLADTFQVEATALFFGAGVLRYTRWQVTGEAYAGASSASLIVLAVVTFPMSLAARSIPATGASGALGSLARVLAALVVAAILVPALKDVQVDSRMRPQRRAVLGVGLAILAFAVLASVAGIVDVGLVTSPVAAARLDLTAGVIWLGLSGLCFRAGLQRRSPSATWSAAAISMLGVASVVRALGGRGGVLSSVVAVAALTLVAALVSVTNASADARNALSGEGNQLLETSGALVDAERLLASIEAHREELVHDARSMIIALQAASTTLDRHADRLDEASSHRLRTAMAVELERLGRLIDGTVSGPVEMFSVPDALGPVVATVREQGLDVTCRLADVWAIGQRDDIAQAVRNLLVNASVHAPGSSVEVRVEVEGGTARVLVEDRGPGMPAGLGNRVFDRGVGAGPGRGSGLGLHMARQLMRAQGGDLQVADRPGGGTCFVASLPVAPAGSAMSTASGVIDKPAEDGLQLCQPGDWGCDLDPVDLHPRGRVRLIGELDNDTRSSLASAAVVDDQFHEARLWLVGEIEERVAATGQGDRQSVGEEPMASINAIASRVVPVCPRHALINPQPGGRLPRQN